MRHYHNETRALTKLTLIREAFSRALDAAPGQREALLAETPAEVRAEVLLLLEAHESAGSFLTPSSDAPLHDGERIGPYVLLENIGSGGMGSVYKARRDDGEFHREVAIKLVGGRLFAPEAERRFIEERRILALLDHPHIVRMIDGGVWQGRRYLVMELVSGEPVTEYCARIPLREKLRLFQSICAAIHYAHQHLIIHRDLKPRNILVTAEGQAKVLDFGIARMMDQGEDPSATALNPMTLACASPEQVQGQRLTLATDIYSLGLILYELLTGTNPQSSGPRLELEQRIVAEEPRTPGSLTPGLPRDLDAIVMKALAKEPQRRYASAGEMAADVERFLDGRPVEARPPSRLYHAARFCGRNKALTAAFAALALAILAGAGASLWQARRAEHQREIAQRRFDEARRLTYTVIHEIQPQLAGINGTLTMREVLIEKTLSYLEALAKDAADSPALLRELIDGYVELAGVAASVGQANLGDVGKATQILAKGQALADTLNRVEPSTPDSVRTLGSFYRASAQHAGSYGRRDVAVGYARKSMDAADRLAALLGDYASRDQAALAAVALASWLPDAKAQVPLYERALGIWREELQKGGHDEAKLTSNIALMYRDISSAWANNRRFREALESASKARDLDAALLKQTPSSPGAQMNLSFDLTAMGSAYADMRNPGAGRPYLEQSVALRQQVAAENPDDRRASERLAYAVFILAKCEKDLGDRPAARRGFERAAGIYDRLSKNAPLVSQSVLKFATATYWLGRFETEAGNRSEGCRSFRRSAELIEAYNAKEPKGAAIADDVRLAARGCRP